MIRTDAEEGSSVHRPADCDGQGDAVCRDQGRPPEVDARFPDGRDHSPSRRGDETHIRPAPQEAIGHGLERVTVDSRDPPESPPPGVPHGTLRQARGLEHEGPHVVQAWTRVDHDLTRRPLVDPPLETGPVDHREQKQRPGYDLRNREVERSRLRITHLDPNPARDVFEALKKTWRTLAPQRRLKRPDGLEVPRVPHSA